VLRTLLLVVLLAVVALLAGLTGLYTGIMSGLPPLEPDQHEPAETTKIFTSGSEPTLLAELHGVENRVIVSGDGIPQCMRDAVVAVEDERFYQHQGVDLIAVGRAVVADVRQRSFAQGASTITQQYIKNAFISSEKTLSRKVMEAALAFQLERQWSKDKILNEYLNTIYFGEGAYGVEAAALTYFGVQAFELTPVQAALLAGITKSPSNYSPRRDPDAALRRRNIILNKMYQQGYLSAPALQEALAAPIELAPVRGNEDVVAPYWVEFVRGQLVAKYGSSTVLKGGLRVYTSIDLERQRMAETAIASTLNQPGDPAAALVAIDPHTGHVVAMVGGSDFQEEQFNIATQGRRQPGSAFKTFVLVAALNMGMSPASTMQSGPVTIELPGDDWEVSSRDMGEITLAQGIAVSANGVFARLIMEVGPGKVVETAHSMGITSPLDPHPAIALGGLTYGVTPMDMAMAYCTLATGGELLSGSVVFDEDRPVAPISIVRVELADGTLLDENRLVRRRVLEPRVAYLATDCLTRVITEGTGKAADIGRPAAGKTGTTQQYRDAWFVGYTPDLVTAVWVGYPKEQRAMTDVHGIAVTGGSFPAEIWSSFMRDALRGVPATAFAVPDQSDWVTVSVCTETGLVATEWCPATNLRDFPAGTEPTKSCGLHGPAEVLVPTVTGMSQEQATAALATHKFIVQVTERAFANAPVGSVLEQHPAGGTRLLQGKVVELVVAIAVPSSPVPGVVGMTDSEASQLLQARGFRVGERSVHDDSPEGRVIDQAPVAGALLAKGELVEITVSMGPEEPGPSTTTTTEPAPPKPPTTTTQKIITTTTKGTLPPPG
jgi:penicillin-binding protein 1A